MTEGRKKRESWRNVEKILPIGRCSKNAVEDRRLCAAHVSIAERAASKPKKK
jgi:hypothetical protein